MSDQLAEIERGYDAWDAHDCDCCPCRACGGTDSDGECPKRCVGCTFHLYAICNLDDLEDDEGDEER